MDTIKLRNFKGSDCCYFLDAGDITIEPIAEWYEIIVKKNGLPLFRMTMNSAYVFAFGFVIGDILNRESFDFPAKMKAESVLETKAITCSDPRVVASVIFMNMLRHKVFKNGKKIKDITLPMLSAEESKDFLRKNNLLCEDPDSDWMPNPPDELIGIPEKVRNLLK
ncbi:MAG: hypothetical protein IKX88_01310 [Thermoguttaceae bacterium]|nr:hypothetical protein [Thermoguttaceae bacterium]MBR5757217.1 hypothetical protein [Thermoguttaceae bacterium]